MIFFSKIALNRGQRKTNTCSTEIRKRKNAIGKKPNEMNFVCVSSIVGVNLFNGN